MRMRRRRMRREKKEQREEQLLIRYYPGLTDLWGGNMFSGNKVTEY